MLIPDKFLIQQMGNIKYNEDIFNNMGRRGREEGDSIFEFGWNNNKNNIFQSFVN